MRLGWSDVTSRALYLNRRGFMAGAVAMAAEPALGAFSTDETPNTFEQITNYNNFYEFGFGKEDPARNAHSLRTEPWAVVIEGLVDRPGSYSVADLAPDNAVEERIYRLRCVEGWSMVIPWLGVPLGPVLERAGIQPSARFVAFETLLDPEQMPEQRRASMPWPYVEGLRLDEAMHPLSLLATGLYGQPMPNQNGAPIRLVVPWKYGFKSIKS
ncbi:MAG: protein-methionine-sulfoxide reductase catalytic subunit MsrP, partial [Paracoccus sp. (in: a-proteobacteria)]|nr:protein-methionine-sulfoxide reductase catalytic subunit MsrP [Paracoccus sp. (in: a-proteobacteria)]